MNRWPNASVERLIDLDPAFLMLVGKAIIPTSSSRFVARRGPHILVEGTVSEATQNWCPHQLTYSSPSVDD